MYEKAKIWVSRIDHSGTLKEGVCLIWGLLDTGLAVKPL